MLDKVCINEDLDIDNQCLIIIPAYNEENSIFKVLEDVSKYFSNILVIDDGSSDNTVKKILDFKKCNLLRHFINCGQGISILTGIRFFLKKSNFKYMITFDADGQHNALDAYKLAKFALENKHKVVFGSRFLSKKKSYIPTYRKIFLKLAVIFENLAFGFKLTDSHNGLRILDNEASELLLDISSSKMAHATEIPLKLISNGIKIYEYPCEVNYKLAKNSTSIFSSANIISDLIQKK
tara:strand:- start:1695 stop:2405 length:711 start_codon:yes stop_codon:yes gene_type:complete